MDNRREFLKRAGLIGGGAMLLSESVRRAFAIDPAPGSTFHDAEHVVILMQENRSFDHVYGSLRGVRGYDDPRAIDLPNGNPVWFQSNRDGHTFAPFRLDIQNTNVTWLGSLPHGWTDQTDARNGGKYDRWLDAKRSGHQECRDMPFTLGAYTREDVPFYYDLADAFTICDQHFCSSLTGTMPNRLYLWSGTIRGSRDASGRARVNNSDVEYENSCAWKTFPDRLEDHGVSWRVYQNEISAVEVGFEGDEAPWLANYGDNPLEWFPQYNVKYSKSYRQNLARIVESYPAEIEKLKASLGQASEADAAKLKKRIAGMETRLQKAPGELAKWTDETFASLSKSERSLHENGCSTNSADPDFHALATLKYRDDDAKADREMQVPKGDVLHRFREDVTNGKLPAVSWLVAPENFSDHPSSAWFGAWYVSEVLNILTQNPEVWKKTIFILTYDENDGYFDHVPPFVAPHPHKPETGAATESAVPIEDFVTMEEELKTKSAAYARESSIGLGYRVPMVIASPWSRGGYVCSQVFDHTSSLQFLEKWLAHKTGKPVVESNISDWRRAVCGDLTASFRPYSGGKIPLPPFLAKEAFVESIHRAQFKPVPKGWKPLTEKEIERARRRDGKNLMLRQEAGTRPSCALPYRLDANGAVSADSKSFEISFASTAKSAGAGFNVYAPGNFRNGAGWERCRSWAFAVASGESLKYSWPIEAFEDGKYFLRVYGPNGFYREFRGSPSDALQISVSSRANGALAVRVANASSSSDTIEITDNAYKSARQSETIAAGATTEYTVETKRASGWHDFSVRARTAPQLEARFAGRVETGRDSISDPLIGARA